MEENKCVLETKNQKSNKVFKICIKVDNKKNFFNL